MSVLTPVESILIRLMIGWVQPLVTPGICSFSFNSVISFSLVIPLRHSDFGFSSIILSIMLIGALSVAVYARPAFPSTLFTSGTETIILSWICKMRLASLLDTSGSVTGINNNVPSSRGGINSEPNRNTNGMLPRTIKIQIAIIVFFQRWPKRNTGL